MLASHTGDEISTKTFKIRANGWSKAVGPAPVPVSELGERALHNKALQSQKVLLMDFIFQKS